MIRVRIDVPPRSYDALVGPGLLSDAGQQLARLLPPAKYQKTYVITVAPVQRRWGAKLLKSLSSSGFKPAFITMPDGEQHKRLATVETLAEKLLAAGADRSSVLIAFGGGVA